MYVCSTWTRWRRRRSGPICCGTKSPRTRRPRRRPRREHCSSTTASERPRWMRERCAGVFTIGSWFWCSCETGVSQSWSFTKRWKTIDYSWFLIIERPIFLPFWKRACGTALNVYILAFLVFRTTMKVDCLSMVFVKHEINHWNVKNDYELSEQFGSWNWWVSIGLARWAEIAFVKKSLNEALFWIRDSEDGHSHRCYRTSWSNCTRRASDSSPSSPTTREKCSGPIRGCRTASTNWDRYGRYTTSVNRGLIL